MKIGIPATIALAAALLGSVVVGVGILNIQPPSGEIPQAYVAITRGTIQQSHPARTASMYVGACAVTSNASALTSYDEAWVPCGDDYRVCRP